MNKAPRATGGLLFFAFCAKRVGTQALLAAVLASSQTPAGVEITAEPHHHFLFQNDYIRVFRVEVAPREITLVHRHRHDYLFVTLGDTEVSNEVEGKPLVRLKLQDAETEFVPGGFAHAARDLAPVPFRNVTVELLQDQKARNHPPPKWDEERGLKVFAGGTQEILFVKDGVRVSEVELQPGAMMPSHHHNGPHLLVAITDLEVRSDVEKMGPDARPFQVRRNEMAPRRLHPYPDQHQPGPREIHNPGIPIATHEIRNIPIAT